MNYRNSIRLLQASAFLGICMPALAQDVPPPPPIQEPIPNQDPEPELQNEQVTNEPVVEPGPVIAPEAAPVPVKPATVSPKKKEPVDSLKPGQFVWEQKEAYEGALKIVVVLDVQRMYVFENDSLIGFTTISAGKKGKETPTGVFNILQKNIDHKSNLYSNAPMPYMQRLTWDGIAMHAGYVPGYPASHGCIRLPYAFAKSLYAITGMDQEVVVLKDISTPVRRPTPTPDPVPPQVQQPVTEPAPVVEVFPNRTGTK